MIRCPACQSSSLRVLGSAHRAFDDNYFRRHRKCKRCGHNFHTREYVEGDEPLTPEDVRMALSFLARAAGRLTKRKKRNAPIDPPQS